MMKTPLLLLLLMFCLSCKQVDTRGKIAPGERLRVVTTTGILKDAVQNIAGDVADVQAIMGSGVDPHLYKATQGDLELLTEAHVIVYNGLHLEGKMGEVLERLSRFKSVVAATDGLTPADMRASSDFPGSYDPHVWFDVALWQKVVAYISQQLQEKDPAHAAQYQQNAAAYLKRLAVLDQFASNAIGSIPEQQRILITAHDAFGYFGDAYGIQVRGLQGISTMSEFGLQDVSSLVNFIADNKIKAVFVESSVSPKAIEAVMVGVRQKGHEIRIGGTLFSDALGDDGTPEGTYEGMVRHNVNHIVAALK
ncbi:metal ABC transporter solute-binding protein, Zn/Mn family [Pontibacter beigongshangensis]|uniref:metal ABC transporter solute-binding protein, Zn/Mn family n=1 Tax=Pontibacter beigongshangensis TaxID=2574733 RepID=UPI00164F3C1E|nr:zinc ABC transporter substrate-binding protein [Pontibacter beigongshangensis]